MDKLFDSLLQLLISLLDISRAIGLHTVFPFDLLQSQIIRQILTILAFSFIDILLALEQLTKFVLIAFDSIGLKNCLFMSILSYSLCAFARNWQFLLGSGDGIYHAFKGDRLVMLVKLLVEHFELAVASGDVEGQRGGLLDVALMHIIFTYQT